MNYLDLIHKFWKINAERNLTPSAVVLYLYLLEEWHNKNEKDFELSDVEISNALKLSRVTIRQAKSLLRNLGLINYQIKQGVPTFYKIITDYSLNRKELDTKKTHTIAEKKPKPTPEPLNAQEKKEPSKITKDKPTLSEFLEYAKTLEGYSPDMNLALKNKFTTWQENNWINGYGRPITNWRQTLKNSLPYLQKSSNDIFQIPNIKRPKSTYNE
ncbi:transcriptional regulator [Ornithobacterium rhinotracheale]|uniref:transcriptional regulator n=1 Tax=Ornithobacterium rhinotracheale TaxID=28251 RepID=UPI0040359ADD